MPSTRCRCSGGPAHHQNDIACWCPKCLGLPAEQRCTAYAPSRPVHLPAPPPADPLPSSRAPEDAPEQALSQPHRPNRAVVAHQVAAAGDEGATCTELATLLGLTPKIVAAELASLQDDNEVTLASRPRITGNAAEDVWLPLSGSDALRVHQSPLWV